MQLDIDVSLPADAYCITLKHLKLGYLGYRDPLIDTPKVVHIQLTDHWMPKVGWGYMAPPCQVYPV